MATATATPSVATTGSVSSSGDGAVSTVQSLVRRVIAPLSRTRVFRRVGPMALPPIEDALRRLTGRRVQLSGLIVPSLVLVSRGAKSGVERESYLMYTPDGHGSAIVAGSNFAGARHPGWTYNLLAHPDARILVRGRAFAVRATLLGDDVRDATWARIERQWPGYRGYERESGRVVRLFRLTPVRRLG